MTILPGYDSFDGRHWETGSVANALGYHGTPMPHTGQPISEALLLGVSGGIAAGYFAFAYEGHPPHLSFLTRWTFDPLDVIYERLGITVDLRGTTHPAKAVANVGAALDAGKPALVWADVFSPPYNDLPHDDSM